MKMGLVIVTSPFLLNALSLASKLIQPFLYYTK